MGKKRGDVSPGVEEAPSEGVPLGQLSEPTPVDAPETTSDPFKGKRGGGDPAKRARHWVVGMDPGNGTFRVLWDGKTRAGALKWMNNVRMLLAGTWTQVRIVRVKTIQPDKWGND